MCKSLIKHFEELDFTVIATVVDMGVNFKVYDKFGESEEGYVYKLAGSDDLLDFTTDLNKSEVYLHGDVRVNGCSDWHFDEQDRGMLHGCNKAGLVRIGLIMGECWDWARELCPNFIQGDVNVEGRGTNLDGVST